MINQEALDIAKKRAMRMGTLYIDGFKDHKFNNPSEVISTLYETGSANTMWSRSGKRQATGYARSILDMCRIIWHYLPDATIEECVKGIYSTSYMVDTWNGKRSAELILDGYCTTVKKLVHRTSVVFSGHERTNSITKFSTRNYYGSSLYGLKYGDLMRYCGII